MYTRKVFSIILMKHFAVITAIICGLFGLLSFLVDFSATMPLYVGLVFVGLALLIHFGSHQIPSYQLCRYKKWIIKAGGDTTKHIKRGQFHTYEYIEENVLEAAIKERTRIIDACYSKCSRAKAEFIESELTKHELKAKDIVEVYYNVVLRV